jgi:hypothetical protein
MKGWVYIITNESKPGIVKVGFTRKDPEGRAKEFDDTHTPDDHRVNYCVLVNDAYKVEQAAFIKLESKRYKKEWFRCDVSEAVKAIREVVGKGALFEDYNETEPEIQAEEERKGPRKRREPLPLTGVLKDLRDDAKGKGKGKGPWGIWELPALKGAVRVKDGHYRGYAECLTCGKVYWPYDYHKCR